MKCTPVSSPSYRRRRKSKARRQLNFDVATYTNDLHALEHMSQDDLMLELRRLGRAQAGGQQVAFVP